jgi:WD40 repeat protein
MTITSRPSKQQKMAVDSNDELRCNLPNCVIVDRILPFVDRSTWDNLIVANREIYQESRRHEAPWPVGELRGVGYEADEKEQLCFSSNGKYLCVCSDQRIRVWHKAVGSCGHIAFEDDTIIDMSLWKVCFSPVENLLISLHEDDDDRSDTFRLWEVNAEGLAFKVEGRVAEVGGVVNCSFSRDGRQLFLICRDSTLRIYSVADAQLIKVIPPIGDGERVFEIVRITADGRFQVVCVEYGHSQTNHRVRLCDIHGDGSTFEDVYVCQESESVSAIATSPLDNSIAIMLSGGVIKLAHRCARDISWTVEVMADGKCFDTEGNMWFTTSGQLLATVRVDGGIQIWDPIKGKYLRTIVCDQLSILVISPDGNLLAATTFSDDRLCLYNI